MAEKSAQSKQLDSDLTIEQVKDQLTEIGKKRGVLTYEEIAERMANFEIESDQMDEYYEYLGEQGVEVMSESEANDDDADPDIQELSKEEEFDLNDLSVPPGVKINDPVRMRHGGFVKLLLVQLLTKQERFVFPFIWLKRLTS